MTDRHERDRVAAEAFYPQHLLPVIGQIEREADAFDLAREQLLLDYGYNTARAYWGDLEHWRDWCDGQIPSVDPLVPVADDIQRYLDHLHEGGYSPNTLARRLTSLRQLFALRIDDVQNPAWAVRPVRRRKRRLTP